MSEQIHNDKISMRLLGFDAAEPVTKHQDYDTSQGGKTQVQRAQGDKGPAAPDPHQMTNDEPRDAQAKIQNQSPKPASAYQVIQRTIEQCNDEGK
jgi:hypothetical protein